MSEMTTNALEGSSNPFWIKFDGPENVLSETIRKKLCIHHGVKSINEAFPGSGQNEWICIMSKGKTFSYTEIARMAALSGFELIKPES